MIENRAMMKMDNYHDAIISMLREILKDDTEIICRDNIWFITSFDDDCFVQKLKNFAYVQSLDRGVNISILIVPFFHLIFYKYIDFLRHEAATAFDVFVRNIQDNRVHQDSKILIRSIEKKHLDTIEAFMNCNLNSLKAADELYLHRNSFNYRLNQFISSTDMDVRDIHTMMFLRLIIDLTH